MTGEERMVLEIDPEAIKWGSLVIAEAILNNEIPIEVTAPIVYEYEVQEIRLDAISSAVLGLTDPIGQIRDFIGGILRWLWDKISSALADVLAKTLAKLGEIAPEIARKIAEAITIISGAIAGAITAITGAISTGLFQISAGITALSTSIVNLGTAVSGAITMIGTSLATQISSVALAISTSIASIGASLAGAIAMVGASIGKAIATVGASLAGAIAMVGTSLGVAITQVATSISGSIVMLGASLSTAITQVSGAIAAGIANIGGAIAQAINVISGAIAQGITSIGTSIAYATGAIMTAFAAGVALLQGRVDYAITIMSDFFPQFVSSLREGYIEMSRAIQDMTREMGRVITDVMRETVRAIAENIITMTDAIIRSMDRAIDAIIDASSRLTNTLLENFRSFMDVLIDAYNRLSYAIDQSLRNFMDALSESFGKLIDTLIDAHNRTVDAILETGRKTIDFIEQASKDITDTILENLDKTMKALMEALEDWAKLMSEIEKTFQGFVNSILQLPERLDPTMKKHAQYTWDEYWTRFYEETSEDLKLVFQEVPKFFKGASLSPFEIIINSIMGRYIPITPSPLTLLPSLFYCTVGDRETAAKTPLILISPGALLSMFFGQLFGVFEKDLPTALSNLTAARSPGVLESIVNAFQGALSWMAKQLESLAKMITDAISGAIAGLTRFFGEAFASLFGAVVGIDLNTVYRRFHSPPIRDLIEVMPWPPWLRPILGLLFGPVIMAMTGNKSIGEAIISYFLEDMVKDLFAFLGIPVPRYLVKDRLAKHWANSMTYVVYFAAMPIFASMLARLISRIAVAIGSMIYNANLPINISLKPLGIGIETQVDIGKVIGGAISHFGRVVREQVDNFANAVTYGFGIWFTQPFARLLNYWLRDSVPVMLPTPDELLEMARRSMPYKVAPEAGAKILVTSHEDVMGVVDFAMAMHGYPSYVVDLMFAKDEYYHIIVEDRFETQRMIPLSMMYNLPSPSDVVRMVIRDIFVKPEEMEKIFAARGMNKDIAALYYLLHFRYPPPEKLWTFICRGISGLLWYSPTQAELEELRKEAQMVKAYEPVAASALNYAGQKLFDALLRYMKWHDYARFAYVKDFTSDNQIMIDSMADIPTKIDQRWMVRFGLYELMSAKGITRASPVSAFATRLVEGQPAGQITLDLTNFCRTLQATGLHPYYVPVTAVAETINAITDERTLLRTGVLNLYKEGFIDLGAVDKFFAGLIVTSFKVSYYNIATHTWVDGYINAPLRYLPMESKLMQLRAVMDRALDILRDIQKDVLTGYQEHIIKTYDDFKAKFTQVINDVNEIYVKELENIIGGTVPEELKLKFIEDYYKPYVDALSIWREIWTVRRIRAFAMRFIGWIMYRVAYGVVTPGELKNMIDYIAKECRMPDDEKTFLSKVMEYMAALSLREYIPTPAQLASMAEYVAIPADVVTKVFDARGVPQEFRGIWSNYISVRPIADDVKAVINAYRRALLYAKVPEDLVNKVKAAMAAINFTDKEAEYLDLRVRLEELVLLSRENVPTPAQIASLAEVCPIPPDLIANAFEARRVAKEWRDIWLKYIQIRPIADDVRALIATYMRALEYAEEARAFFPAVQSLAAMVGYGATEMQVLELRGKLEELIYKARSYVPTPTTLATICEVLPEARHYFDDMVRRLRIPPEWAALWAKYIDIRPLVDDIKRVLSRAEDLYCYFVITEENFMAILESVAGYLGYTDKEKEFLLYVTKLRRYFTAWRELVADVDRMMSIAEYSPTAREFALGQLYKMVDALPIDDETKATIKRMWEEYIRIRPVRDEVSRYITDLINAYVEGVITEQMLVEELEALKEWGLDDYEIQFYKAIATLRRARKLKIRFY